MALPEIVVCVHSHGLHVHHSRSYHCHHSHSYHGPGNHYAQYDHYHSHNCDRAL